jgi:hypothetical protein
MRPVGRTINTSASSRCGTIGFVGSGSNDDQPEFENPGRIPSIAKSERVIQTTRDGLDSIVKHQCYDHAGTPLRHGGLRIA